MFVLFYSFSPSLQNSIMCIPEDDLLISDFFQSKHQCVDSYLRNPMCLRAIPFAEIVSVCVCVLYMEYVCRKLISKPVIRDCWKSSSEPEAEFITACESEEHTGESQPVQTEGYPVCLPRCLLESPCKHSSVYSGMVSLLDQQVSNRDLFLIQCLIWGQTDI